jgi:hypothetical protein
LTAAPARNAGCFFICHGLYRVEKLFSAYISNALADVLYLTRLATLARAADDLLTTNSSSSSSPSSLNRRTAITMSTFGGFGGFGQNNNNNNQQQQNTGFGGFGANNSSTTNTGKSYLSLSHLLYCIITSSHPSPQHSLITGHPHRLWNNQQCLRFYREQHNWRWSLWQHVHQYERRLRQWRRYVQSAFETASLQACFDFVFQGNMSGLMELRNRIHYRTSPTAAFLRTSIHLCSLKGQITSTASALSSVRQANHHSRLRLYKFRLWSCKTSVWRVQHDYWRALRLK